MGVCISGTDVVWSHAGFSATDWFIWEQLTFDGEQRFNIKHLKSGSKALTQLAATLSPISQRHEIHLSADFFQSHFKAEFQKLVNTKFH